MSLIGTLDRRTAHNLPAQEVFEAEYLTPQETLEDPLPTFLGSWSLVSCPS